MNGSFQFDPDTKSAAENVGAYGKPSPKKLEKVRQNMEMKDAIKFRANTNNRGYGFEQLVDKEVEEKHVDVPEDDSKLPNPYVYNYRPAAAPKV